MKTPFVLGSPVSLEEFREIACGFRKVRLSASAVRLMESRRKRLLRIAAEKTVYGVNTGFGELASTRISPEKRKTLQLNLIRSHSCGWGEPLSDEETRGLLFLRANELAKGRSGVRPRIVAILAECVNKGVIPYIPSRGSVGASGDLAPSAHAALVLIGEGRAKISGGSWISGAAALKKAGIKPIALEEKEGLSLINGTQAMQSVGGLALFDSLNVWEAALCASALCAEALKATPEPFSRELNSLKPHAGQVFTARKLDSLLALSEIRQSHKEGDPRVQDPYSIRCVPQVHGAILDALSYAKKTLETEMASFTDNPLISLENFSVLSGGNFHGQPLSLAFDFACAAMAPLGGISERRVFQLISGGGGILPPFLAEDSGLESGWMIAQYLAAGLASENKTLAHPAGADSIPTSANKEDFVSMGMWAARKFRLAVNNCSAIIAVELLAAARGVEFHRPLAPGKGAARVYKKIRSLVAEITRDQPLTGAVETVSRAVLAGVFR